MPRGSKLSVYEVKEIEFDLRLKDKAPTFHKSAPSLISMSTEQESTSIAPQSLATFETSLSRITTLPPIDERVYETLCRGKVKKFKKKVLSKIGNDSIRWINKRKINITDRVTHGTPRSRIAELKKLFDAFDRHGEGEINIGILQEGVREILSSHPKIKGLIRDEDYVQRFFFNMDTNGDGSIDFSEFLAVMGGEIDRNEFSQFIDTFEEVLFEYSKNFRRKSVTENLQPKPLTKRMRTRTSSWIDLSMVNKKPGTIDNGVEVKEALKSFKKLFQIKYFSEDFAAVKDDAFVKKKFEAYAREMNGADQRVMSTQELNRARKGLKKLRCNSSNNSSVSSKRLSPSKSSKNYSQYDPLSSIDSLSTLQINSP